MIDLNKPKKKTKSKFKSFIIITILVIILFFLMGQVLESNNKNNESKEKRMASEFLYEELLERKESLQNDIHKLESKVGQEEELRNRFSVAKEDEKLIVLVKNEQEDKESEPEKKDSGPIGFFKGLFGIEN